jgi:hypothetical protein
MAPANELLQYAEYRPPTAPTLPLRPRDYGTSCWQLYLEKLNGF